MRARTDGQQNAGAKGNNADGGDRSCATNDQHTNDSDRAGADGAIDKNVTHARQTNRALFCQLFHIKRDDNNITAQKLLLGMTHLLSASVVAARSELELHSRNASVECYLSQMAQIRRRSSAAKMGGAS